MKDYLLSDVERTQIIILLNERRFMDVKRILNKLEEDKLSYDELIKIIDENSFDNKDLDIGKLIFVSTLKEKIDEKLGNKPKEK